MEITTEIIDGWKKKFGHVYKTGDNIYFRPLSRTEYISLITDQQKDPETFDYELTVSTLCVLSGVSESDFTLKSGLPTALCEQILLKSGFGTSLEVEEL